MIGWIKLHRKLTENPIWTSEVFTRGQAWVDLLLLANHEYGFFYLRDHKVEVQRGQVGYSQLKLSERWQWSRTKVRKFLNDLEKEQQIIQQQSHSTSIITIINYEEYQKKEQLDIQQEDNRKTTGRQQEDTNKNNKEETKNENNKNSKLALAERQKIFYEELKGFVDDYPKDTLRAFYDYWSEPNMSKTKMRLEMEKTWEIGRRLSNWHKRSQNGHDGKFNPNGTPTVYVPVKEKTDWK